LTIFEKYIDYRNEDGTRLQNRNVDSWMVELFFNLPYRLMSKKHFEFIEYAFSVESWIISRTIVDIGLRRLIAYKDSELIILLLQTIFSPSDAQNALRIKHRFKDFSSTIESSLKECLPDLVEICEKKAFYFFKGVLNKIWTEEKTHFHWSNIPSISFTSSNQRPYGESLLSLIVKFTSSILEYPQKDITKEVSNLINSDIPIFRRIAINIINIKYEECKKEFFNINYNPLHNYELHTEISNLLNNKADLFSDREITKILSWIDDYLSFCYSEYFTNQIHRWIKLLEPSNNPLVISRLKDLEKTDKIGLSDDYADFRPVKTSIGWEKDIIDVNSFIGLNPEEIISYLSQNQERDLLSGVHFTVKGNLLEEYICDVPANFFSNIEQFKIITSDYCINVIAACNKLFHDKQFDYWKEIFSFLKAQVEKEDFFEERFHGRAIEVTRFLRTGMTNDETAFDLEYMLVAKSILFKIFSNSQPEIKTPNDLAFEALNRTYCIVLTTFVTYSLRLARAEDKVLEKWDKDIKALFDDLLLNNPTFELHYTLGTYFENFKWLDENWIFLNWSKIFPKNEEFWFSTFKSYIFSTNKLYINSYKLLKDKGELERALSNDSFIISETGHKFIGWITLAYATDIEKIGAKNNLIEKIINSKNPRLYRAVIRSVWIRKNYPRIKESQMKDLWGRMIKKANQNIHSKDFKKVAGFFATWIPYCSIEDDKIYEWLKITAKHIHHSYYRKELYVNLLEQIEIAPERIGNLILLSANGNSYIRGQEELKKIVTYLFENNLSELAQKICHEFGEIGNTSLASIYKKYYQL